MEKNKNLLCIQSKFGFVHKAKKACSTSRSWGSNLALFQRKNKNIKLEQK